MKFVACPAIVQWKVYSFTLVLRKVFFLRVLFHNDVDVFCRIEVPFFEALLLGFVSPLRLGKGNTL